MINFSNNVDEKYNYISNIKLLKYFTNTHSLKNLDEENKLPKANHLHQIGQLNYQKKLMD